MVNSTPVLPRNRSTYLSSDAAALRTKLLDSKFRHRFLLTAAKDRVANRLVDIFLMNERHQELLLKLESHRQKMEAETLDVMVDLGMNRYCDDKEEKDDDDEILIRPPTPMPGMLPPPLPPKDKKKKTKEYLFNIPLSRH